MLKRLTALILTLAFLLTGFAFAEDDDADAEVDESKLTAEQLKEIHDLDDINEDEEDTKFVVGETWHEMEIILND